MQENKVKSLPKKDVVSKFLPKIKPMKKDVCSPASEMKNGTVKKG